MKIQFYTADVFTSTPFHGAQIAVFPDAEGLDEGLMQSIAKEMNLSESVFVFPSTNGANTWRTRIFSPLGEVEFGGHPIIATAHVLASIGNIELKEQNTTVVLEQNIGPIEVNITGEGGQPLLIQFSLRTHHQIDRFVPLPGELAEILSLPTAEFESYKYTPLMVSCGYPYLIVPIRNHAAVRKAQFNFKAWGQSTAPATFAREILLFSTETESSNYDFPCDFHGRLMGPHIGFDADPPIGSAMPAFAGFLSAHEHIKEGTYCFSIDRGEAATRRSVLSIELDNTGSADLTIRVGGPAVMVGEGTLTLPA